MSDGKRTSLEILKGDNKLTKQESDFTIPENTEYIGIYFSAHWCPPCRTFTPVLTEFYNKNIKDREPMEIVFVSSDKDQDSFDEYFGEMPWAALKFGERTDKAELADIYGIRGIPTLIVIDKHGVVKDDGARASVQSSPDAIPKKWTE